MGMTTTLPASINLAAIGDTESGTATIVANSGTTTVNYDDSVVSVAMTTGQSTQVVTPGYEFQEFPFNWAIDGITITAVGNGSTTLEIVSGKTSVTPTVSVPVTVGAVEDESYLNKRGLTHFWENIDDLKQDKLTAGTGISITGNTISAMVDSTLSSTSTNPVQNAVIYNAIGNIETILSTLNNGGGAQ